MIADVCLVLEGTWPIRVGGVGRWVESLVRGLPDLSFAIAHLTAGPLPSAAFRIPQNVVEVAYIDVSRSHPLPQPELARQVPNARVIHALSSGEAGWLAYWAARGRGCPLVLTEHGIAWREAAAGCGQLESGRHLDDDDLDVASDLLRAAQTVYRRADIITTVNRDNLELMVSAGAPPAITRVIPNWTPDRRQRVVTPDAEGLHFGYVGRVVELKDPLTFVKAASRVAQLDRKARFTLVGPLDHSPAYASQVREAATRLGLDGVFTFVGQQDSDEWLPRFDVLVLTSKSEAQPLVLLEAMARGIPCVATDVGGCAELLSGSTPAGIVVPQEDPVSTADAMLLLTRSPELRVELGNSGRRRVRLSHSEWAGLAAYREMYGRAFSMALTTGPDESQLKRPGGPAHRSPASQVRP